MDPTIETIDFNTYYFSDNDLKKFYASFLEASKIFGCSYISYVYEDKINKARIGFVTNPDWQREFITNHLIDNCHMKKAVTEHFKNTENQYFILRWENVKPHTSKQKDVYLYRKEIGIGTNGVSFCSSSSKAVECLAFAPDINETRFLQYVVKNLDIVRKCCKLLRESAYNTIHKDLATINLRSTHHD